MQENDKNIDKIAKAAEALLKGKKMPKSIDPKTQAVIKQLLMKQEVEADPRFKKTLDKLINQTLGNIRRSRSNYNPLKEKAMKYFLTFLSGAFATTVIVLVILNQKNIVTLPFEKDAVDEGVKIETVVEGDELALLSEAEQVVNEVSHEDFGDIPEIEQVEAGKGGGGGGGEALATSSKEIGAGGGGFVERAIIPPYPGGELYPPEVTYDYTGDTNVSIPQSLSIYKTQRSELAVSRIQSIISQFGFDIGGIIEEGRIVMQYFSFANPKEKLNYSVDFNNGILTFHKTYQHDPDRKRATEEDVPSDSELITIANAFLKKHGIDPATLNPPEIDNQWRVYYEREKARMEKVGDSYIPYIPDQIRVIYPQMIENIPVVDFGGTNVGQVNLHINIFDKEVVSGGIQLSLDLDKTDYPAQDFEEIIAILEETGGTNAFNFGPRPLRIETPDEDLKPADIDVAYDEAMLAYFRKYDWREGESKTYYIPVVMFKGEVTHSGEEEPYDQSTFVPVISSENF
jgi:hypothetical protein